MSELHYHRQLSLLNFTIFQNVQLDFGPGINVLVGENGSGKTHLMKALFASQFAYARSEKLPNVLEGVFQADHFSSLIRQGEASGWTALKGIYGSQSWECYFGPDYSSSMTQNPAQITISRPVFIPAIDMMGHTRRFVATYDEYKIDFDLTHRDIVSLLLSPEKRTPNSKEEDALQVQLIALLGGQVEEEQERFYLRTKQGRQPMPLVAEGLRKIATLQQLIKNGWLNPGSTLYWDEPENNINPKLITSLASVLLALARQGVQVFLATHSYLILKELEVQAAKSDSLRFFALERTETETLVHPANSYLDLSPNLIEQEYLSLYDRGIEKRIQEVK